MNLKGKNYLKTKIVECQTEKTENNVSKAKTLQKV